MPLTSQPVDCQTKIRPVKGAVEMSQKEGDTIMGTASRIGESFVPGLIAPTAATCPGELGLTNERQATKMVTICNRIRSRQPTSHDGQLDTRVKRFRWTPKATYLRCPVMENCPYLCSDGRDSSRSAATGQQHPESDPFQSLLAGSTTMETDDSPSSKRMIMNQSHESTINADCGFAMTKLACHFMQPTGLAHDENSNLHPDNESRAADHLQGYLRYHGRSVGRPPFHGAQRYHRYEPVSISNTSLGSSPNFPRYLWLPMCLALVLSAACLAQAGFWTFYFPNFLKPSGYKELSDMIETLDIQINSTIDAHADAMFFWGLLKMADVGQEEASEEYYPEESACEQVFPLFLDKAIEYAKVDFEHYMKPLQAYREHLVQSRAMWFHDGPKTKNILPRQFEQNLHKRDLELKIESFDFIANSPELRQRRQQLVSIWRNVKRSLDNSLTCVRLRYAYRHVAEDINQFALDMNLKSLHQAMEMLEAAYKRVALYKSEDMVATERIKDDMERVENLVMID